MDSLENAIGYLNKAVNILPDSMAIIFNERGLVYELMDSLELAAIDYYSAFQIDPTWAIPYSNYANTFYAIDTSNSKLAMEYYRKAQLKARNLNKNLPAANLGLGIVLANVNPDSALEELKKEIEGNIYEEHDFAIARALHIQGDHHGELLIYDKISNGNFKPRKKRRAILGKAHHHMDELEYDTAVTEYGRLLKNRNQRFRKKAYAGLYNIYLTLDTQANTDSLKHEIKKLFKSEVLKLILVPQAYAYANLTGLRTRSIDSLKIAASQRVKLPGKARFYRQAAVTLFQYGDTTTAIQVARIGRNETSESVVAHVTFIDIRTVKANVTKNYRPPTAAVERAEMDLRGRQFQRLLCNHILKKPFYTPLQGSPNWDASWICNI